MKIISGNLGRIIAALAAVALLICAVVGFKAPIGDFFGSVINKENAISDKIAGNLDNVSLQTMMIKIIEGNKAVVNKTAPTPLTMRSNAEYEDFQEVKVDGATVAASNYTVSSGSTVVTFKADYLASLSEGEHDIAIVSTTGTAKGTFTVSTEDGGASGDDYDHNAPELHPSNITLVDGVYTHGNYTYTPTGSGTMVGVMSLEQARELTKPQLEQMTGMSWTEILAMLAQEGVTEEMIWEEQGLTDETFVPYTYESWSVSVTDKTLTEYGPILESINGAPITSLSGTFYGCTNMETAPVIPKHVETLYEAFFNCSLLVTAPDLDGCTDLTNMSGTFYGCTNMETAPAIPISVTVMFNTFKGCSALTGIITINGNSGNYNRQDCFSGVDFDAQNITLAGSSTKLDELGATGSNYCAECNGKCFGNH